MIFATEGALMGLPGSEIERLGLNLRRRRVTRGRKGNATSTERYRLSTWRRESGRGRVALVPVRNP